MKKLRDSFKYLKSVVELQCKMAEGPRRVPCQSFSSLCYQGVNCSICGGRGWVYAMNKERFN